MHFVLALLLQTAPAPEAPVLPSKAEVVEAFDQAKKLTTDIIDILPTRLGVNPNQPYLGFAMRTEEMGIGNDGLPQRYTFIASVFRGTPAFDAGVRSGDRIAAIGPIECDTLKPKAVSFYLGEYPDAVPLTLERDGKRLPVSVRRAPLACAALAWQQFPVASWKDRLTRIQSRITSLQTAMASVEQLTREQTTQALITYGQTIELVDRVLTEMSNQLNPATSPFCDVVK